MSANYLKEEDRWQAIFRLLSDRYKYFIRYYHEDKIAVIGVRQKKSDRVYGEILYSPVDPTNVGANRTYSSDVMEKLILKGPKDDRYIEITRDPRDAIKDISDVGFEEIDLHFRSQITS